MRWNFLGAAREVTGSCHMIEVGKSRLLMDYGLFQGRREESWLKNREPAFDVNALDSVVLGHAHADHAANLPSLARLGYRGEVHCTPATRDLCAIMLQDSAHIQEKDFEHLRRNSRATGHMEPLYRAEDATEIVTAFSTHSYQKKFTPVEGAEVTFTDAGHILGSALTRMELSEGDRKVSVLYACDLGRDGLPILRNPQDPGEAEVLVMESTYGDRLHSDIAQAGDQLAEALGRALGRGGKVIIPAFSLGRTQEILYAMHQLEDEGRLPRVPVYVDSPLSFDVTEIFRIHPECFDAEMREHLRVHPDPLGMARLRFVRNVEDSKKLNRTAGPMVVISASGMCEAGRVLHHLRHAIEDPKNMILLVGFMAEHTLGRRIRERQPEVKIYGELVKLRSEVVVMDAFSAHADQAGLLALARQVKPRKIFLVHGESVAQEVLRQKLQEAGFHDVVLPARGDSATL